MIDSLHGFVQEELLSLIFSLHVLAISGHLQAGSLKCVVNDPQKRTICYTDNINTFTGVLADAMYPCTLCGQNTVTEC
jgi:hypothetical protein